MMQLKFTKKWEWTTHITLRGRLRPQLITKIVTRNLPIPEGIAVRAGIFLVALGP